MRRNMIYRHWKDCENFIVDAVIDPADIPSAAQQSPDIDCHRLRRVALRVAPTRPRYDVAPRNKPTFKAAQSWLFGT